MRIAKYLAYRCTACGRWSGRQLNKYHDNISITAARKVLNTLKCSCKYDSCRKNMKFKEEGKPIGIIHEWFNHNWKMFKFIQEKNALRRKTN